MDELLKMDATEQAAIIKTGAVSELEVLEAAITRIEKVDQEINAVIHCRFQRAREDLVSGLPNGPFKGVPFLLKDSIPYKGEPYHLGMRALKQSGYQADHDSYLVNRYKQAGVVLLG